MGSKPLVRPPRLGPGCRIGLLAPAGPLLERDDLTRAEELCRALGYEPMLGSSAHRRHGYLAGTDAERLADLDWALSSPTIDAIWCIRGGYGSLRLLDRVNYEHVIRRPKAIIGFSDITALLNAVTQQAGVVTYHAPVARASMSRFSREHFERVLASGTAPGRLGRIQPPADILVPQEHRIVSLHPGVAEGRLAGGNLTLLHCLVGTPYFPDLENAILFLEDVGERLYNVDRMLAHLRLIGAFRSLAGVIVGRFTEIDRASRDGALGFDEILGTYFEPLGIPVAYGFPIGHVDAQWTLPLGVRVRLDAGAGEVDILEPAVA